MRETEVNGKKYDLYFGIDFIREMDKRYQLVNESGVLFGLGLTNVVVYIQDKNPVTLTDIILSVTHTLKFIPSFADIEKWLEEQEDLEKALDDFLPALKTASLTKSKVREMLEVVKDQEAK